MVFCSPSTCHVEPQSMIRVMHQSLNDCVLSLWRKSTAKLATEYCFFMTTPPFTSARLFRLLFDRLASLNWITQSILQRLHRLIPICCQTWINFFVWGILAPMTKQSPLLRTIWLILIQKFFVKAYKACMAAGSVWRSVHSINTIIVYPRFDSIWVARTFWTTWYFVIVLTFY